MIQRIVAALLSSVKSLKVIDLTGANWNTNEAVIELVNLVSVALNLQIVDIKDQRNPIILLEMDKTTKTSDCFIRARSDVTKKEIHSAKTALD